MPNRTLMWALLIAAAAVACWLASVVVSGPEFSVTAVPMASASEEPRSAGGRRTVDEETAIVREGVGPTESVEGQITISTVDASGMPVAGTELFASGTATPTSPARMSRRIGATDGFGVARVPEAPTFPQPAAGQEILLTKAGFQDARIVLDGGKHYSVVLVEGSLLEVECCDTIGNPLPGVTLSLSQASIPPDWDVAESERGAVHLSRQSIYTGRADSSGRIAISNLPAGLYQLLFEAPGYAPRVHRSSSEISIDHDVSMKMVFAGLAAVCIDVSGDELVSYAWEPTKSGGSAAKLMEASIRRQTGAEIVSVRPEPKAGEAQTVPVKLLFARKGAVNHQAKLARIGREITPERLDVAGLPDLAEFGFLTVKVDPDQFPRAADCDRLFVAKQADSGNGRRIGAAAWVREVRVGQRVAMPAGDYRVEWLDVSLTNWIENAKLTVRGGEDSEHQLVLKAPLVCVHVDCSGPLSRRRNIEAAVSTVDGTYNCAINSPSGEGLLFWVPAWLAGRINCSAFGCTGWSVQFPASRAVPGTVITFEPVLLPSR